MKMNLSSLLMTSVEQRYESDVFRLLFLKSFPIIKCDHFYTVLEVRILYLCFLSSSVKVAYLFLCLKMLQFVFTVAVTQYSNLILQLLI